MLRFLRAETRGFEPPRPFNGPTSLAVRRTRPGYATSPRAMTVYNPTRPSTKQLNSTNSGQNLGKKLDYALFARLKIADKVRKLKSTFICSPGVKP